MHQSVSRRLLIDCILILLGVLSAAFGLKGFLIPNNFIDGGVTGVALLVAALSGIPLPFLLILINIPFLYLGYKVIGRTFSYRAGAAILMLALATSIISVPTITDDKLLISVFGGFFLGCGIGLAVRGGAVIDGTEILAVYLNRRLGTTIGDIILILNIMIFSIAAYLLSLETALYSILIYLSASKTVDFVIDGIEEYTAALIVSDKSEELRKAMTYSLGLGVTIIKGKSGYGTHGNKPGEFDILYTVITRFDIGKLNAEIEQIDPRAFVSYSLVKNTRGGIIKRLPHRY
jgi:uncharacterized membrane-anchored protein YitT (DUF2179 family)